ncbi:ribokinase [Enterococcus ureilyticus]|uniref:Ribokinase n=1 Tax=Enterococcus ureilyticus TaxID=1131292 RepID=A0A1E5H8U0_9ENTE|nr:ribokinase [Enterococcus ureilyticus]MBM7687520.1 ribokinase [Enterococcus ureilyticus]OEG21353.1 ribokinase [Enterococcus ureilyticus]
MKKVAVIGSISTDFVVTTKIIPNQGETLVGESFQTFFGGKGANQAIALSRSGLDVSMIGAVGKDVFGQALIDNLKENGINTDMIQTVDTAESGSAHIQVMDGDNRIIIIPGANDRLSIDVVKQYQQQLQQMEMVILQNEIPVETIEYIIDFCATQRIQVLYNPAPAKEISEEYIEKVTYLTPNEHEAVLLFGNKERAEVLRNYPNKLIITLGNQGATFFDGEAEVIVPAQKVATVIDTTGAGDTFNGYFAKGILEGLTIAESLKLGNAASAIAIQTKGAQNGIPMYEKVVASL